MICSVSHDTVKTFNLVTLKLELQLEIIASKNSVCTDVAGTNVSRGEVNVSVSSQSAVNSQPSMFGELMSFLHCSLFVISSLLPPD